MPPMETARVHVFFNIMYLMLQTCILFGDVNDMTLKTPLAISYLYVIAQVHKGPQINVSYIDPTRKCRIDVQSTSTQGYL